MNKEIQQQAIDMIHSLGSGIATLGDKIGIGAAHMWPILVKQQYIDGLTGLISDVMGILIFVSLIFIFIMALKSFKNLGRYEAGEPQIIVMILCGIIGLPSLVISTVSITDDMRHLLNPEYYAAIDIIERIK